MSILLGWTAIVCTCAAVVLAAGVMLDLRQVRALKREHELQAQMLCRRTPDSWPAHPYSRCLPEPASWTPEALDAVAHAIRDERAIEEELAVAELHCDIEEYGPQWFADQERRKK